MDFEIRFHVKEEFIHCIVLGFNGTKNFLEIWKRISKEIQKFSIHKVLLNSYLKNQGKENRDISMSHIFLDSGIKHEDKISIVNLNYETMPEFKQYEKELKEEGYHVALFQNQEEALQWLLNN